MVTSSMGSHPKSYIKFLFGQQNKVKLGRFEAKMDPYLNATNAHKRYWKKSLFNLNAILPVYGLILLICLVGNILVCLTIIRNKRMRSRWHFLLINLAIADMGFALTTPIQALQFVNVNLGL